MAWYQIVIVIVAGGAILELFVLTANAIVTGRDVPPNLVQLVVGLLTLTGTVFGTVFASKTINQLRKKPDDPEAEIDQGGEDK